MIRVAVTGNKNDVKELVSAANRMQSRFSFSDDPNEGIRLELKASPAQELVSVDRQKGIVICTDQSEGICLYANIPRSFYLLTASLLGLMYWHALQLNPLLIWEDFQVKEDSPGCLCAHRERLCEYALAFETPHICQGCLDFFRCLGAEPEVSILQDVLNQLPQPVQVVNR